MKNIHLHIFIVFALFSLPPVASASLVPVTLVTRVDVTRSTDSGAFTVHISTSGPQPDYSSPENWGTAGVNIDIKNARLAESFTQSDAAGPLMAYNLVQNPGSVSIRLSFLDASVRASVSWSDQDSALLITLEEGGLPEPTPPVLPSGIGIVSQDPSSNTNSPRSPGTESKIDFRATLLAAAKNISNGVEPPATSTASASVSDRIGYAPERATTSSVFARNAVLESSTKWQLDTIVLDAGHGGWDEGAVSRSGLMEKNLALLIVRNLGHRIERELGIRVVYTRNGDDFIPLAERGRVANQSGGKLFISIHANQAMARSAHGTETYFLGTHRSDSARVVMERENEIVGLEDDTAAYNALNSQELAMRRISQSANLQESESLAAFVEEAFEQTTDRKSRGVKQAGFYVLFGASMPAVLVELGFLSNSREASYLGSTEGQAALTESLFLAISRFKADYEKGLNVASR
jgi:N-acetylmuramoyl-L-alanine amidase